MSQKLRTSRILGRAVSIVITTLSETGSNLQHIFCNLPNEDRCLERALAAEDELAWGVMQDILEACTGVGAGLVNLAAVLSANFQRPLEDLEGAVLMDADEKKDALLHARRRHESCAAALTESLKKKEKATSKLNSMQASDAGRPWFGKMQKMPHLSIPTMESFMDSSSDAMQKAMAKQSEAVRVFNACKEACGPGEGDEDPPPDEPPPPEPESAPAGDEQGGEPTGADAQSEAREVARKIARERCPQFATLESAERDLAPGEETEEMTRLAQASLEDYCAMSTYTQCTLQQILCSSLMMLARALNGVSSGGVQALQARARHVRPPTPVTDAPKPEWATCAAGRPPHRPSKAAQRPPPPPHPPAESGNPFHPEPERSRRSKPASDKEEDCGNASPSAMSDLSEDSADFSVGDTVVVDGRHGVIVWDGRAEGVSLIKVHWAGSEDSSILHRDEITGIVPSSEAADKQSEARAAVKRAAEDVEACCKKAVDARSSAATTSAAMQGIAARGGTSRSKAGATRRDEPKDRDTGKPGGEFANGEIAEVVILDGTDAGLWLKCRILGRGGEAGTYNIQILPCADTNIERRYQINIKPVHLRKCAGGSSHYPTLLGQTPIESPQAPKKAAAEKEEWRALKFREGELAEVIVLDGEHAGTWLRCRVAGPGGRAASFNISVLPTATWQSSQIDDVEVAHLRKIQAPDLAEITPSTCGGSEEYHLEPAASPKGDQTGVDNPCGAEVDDAPL